MKIVIVMKRRGKRRMAVSMKRGRRRRRGVSDAVDDEIVEEGDIAPVAIGTYLLIWGGGGSYTDDDEEEEGEIVTLPISWSGRLMRRRRKVAVDVVDKEMEEEGDTTDCSAS